MATSRPIVLDEDLFRVAARRYLGSRSLPAADAEVVRAFAADAARQAAAYVPEAVEPGTPPRLRLRAPDGTFVLVPWPAAAADARPLPAPGADAPAGRVADATPAPLAAAALSASPAMGVYASRPRPDRAVRVGAPRRPGDPGYVSAAEDAADRPRVGEPGGPSF